MNLHTIIAQCLPKERSEYGERYSSTQEDISYGYNQALSDVKSTIPTIVELLIAEIEKMDITDSEIDQVGGVCSEFADGWNDARDTIVYSLKQK
jgi:hypothetical protein